jgi:cathepsin A (carboxypeptidase C)
VCLVVHLDCPDSECSDRRKGNFTALLNQDHVKEALRFPPSFTFSPIAWPVNQGYSDGRTPYKPTTRELAAVLEAHEARPALRADVRLLVLPGSVLAYDAFGWSGQADFRAARFADLPADVDAATGFWKATPDQRLVFVALDGAGHTVPGDVRQGSYQVVQKFIARDWQP